MFQKEGENMTIKQAIEKGAVELKVGNVDTPKMKARLLMQYILNQTRQYIIVHDMQELSERDINQYFLCIRKMKNGVPIEHITHQKEFMKLNFFVNQDVLIPRQDTEILVEEVIKIAKNIRAKKILDLCTGSGAIAVSLAKYLSQIEEITALDISHDAIQIAKKNVVFHKVENKITFIESDLFKNLAKQKYDMIVSNPPYIKRDIMKKLDKQVQKEPQIALDGGYDGLDFYRRIIKEAYQYLKFGGYLCLEIGYDQKEDVINLIEEEHQYSNTYCLKDLCDNDRVIVTKVL